MAEPDLIQRLSIGPDSLNVFVVFRTITYNDAYGLAVVQTDGEAIKNRAGKIVNRHAGRDRIKSHHRKDDKRAHAATVLVTGHSKSRVSEPGVEQHADALLGFPGRTEIVVDVRSVQAGFVAHRELSHQSAGIGKFMPEIKLA